MATDPIEYGKAMPIVAAHLAKVERAFSRTRSSHIGQPYTTVRQALLEALQHGPPARKTPNESYRRSSTSSPGGSLKSGNGSRSDIHS